MKSGLSNYSEDKEDEEALGSSSEDEATKDKYKLDPYYKTLPDNVK